MWIRVARFYLEQELLNQLTGRLTDHYSPADPIHCRPGEREMKSLQELQLSHAQRTQRDQHVRNRFRENSKREGRINATSDLVRADLRPA